MKPSKTKNISSSGPAERLSCLDLCLEPQLSGCRGSRVIFGFSYRFVITRPCNTFKLLPSDLVFCAIPFSTSCYKLDTTSPSPYETINIVPTSEKTTNTNQSSTINPVSQTTTQPLTTSVHYLEPKTSSISDSKQTVLTQSSKLPSQTYLGETETMRENGKEKMKERTEENAPASSKPN